MAHFQKHRNGTQRTEYPANAKRIRDGLAQAVLLRDFKAICAGLITANLNMLSA